MMEVTGDDTPGASPGSTAADSGLARVWKRLTNWFKSAWQVMIVIIILAVGSFMYIIFSRGAEGPALSEGIEPDASVFISTLILIYTVFIAVYGALLPVLITRKRSAWYWLAIVLMVGAIMLNLWRIQNSLGDLYTTTMRQLTPDKIHDAGYEFMHYYFLSNVMVIVIALVFINVLPRTANGKRPGSDRP